MDGIKKWKSYPEDLIGATPIKFLPLGSVPEYITLPAVTRIIREATVMRSGWEGDYLAWVVELEDGSVVILTTLVSGSLYLWEDEAIQENLDETQQSVDGILELVRIRDAGNAIGQQAAGQLGDQDLIYRLRKRAEIRRQIQSRKSVQEGKADRLADLLDEAAADIERLKRDVENLSFKT